MATPPPVNANAIVPFVGMYSQPIRLMDEAAKRGGNLMYKAELENGKVKRADWRAACRDHGFYYLDEPGDDLDADMADPWLLGWLLPHSDEWNRVRGTTLQDPQPLIEGARFLRQRLVDKGLSTKLDNATAGKWVGANADGQAITTSLFEKPPYNGVKGNEVAVMRELSLCTFDDYPVVNTSANTPEEIARRPMWLPAAALLRIQTWLGSLIAAITDFGCIVEANHGYKSPLAVTPAQMREQRDYLLGRKSFPFPIDPLRDGKTRVQTSVQTLPRVWVWWTGNGQDGPGWKWLAQDEAQVATQIEITKELLGSPAVPGPVPPDGPGPVVPPDDARYVTVEAFEAWKRQADEVLKTVAGAARDAAASAGKAHERIDAMLEAGK